MTFKVGQVVEALKNKYGITTEGCRLLVTKVFGDYFNGRLIYHPIFKKRIHLGHDYFDLEKQYFIPVQKSKRNLPDWF